MKGKYIASKIGLIISIPGLILVLIPLIPELAILIALPLLSILPIALPLEILGSEIFTDYSNTALLVLIVLLTLFILSNFYYFRNFIRHLNNNHKFNSGRLIVYFGIQFVLLHPLVFYIWAFQNADSASDGQFIFGIFETFPLSSLIFLLLAITIDIIKNKKLMLTPATCD